MLSLLFVLGAQVVLTPSDNSSFYLTIAAEYRSGDRERAVRAIGTWSRYAIFSAVQGLRAEGDRTTLFRAGEKQRLPVPIDARTVEAAALMHVEVGLQSLHSLGVARAGTHLSAATTLVEWLHALAAPRLALRAKLLDLGFTKDAAGEIDPVREQALDRATIVPLTIDKRAFYVALAGATLALGYPETAEPYAAKAVAAAPRDGEALLFHASAKESLAHHYAVRRREQDARKLREESVALFQKAMEADPAQMEAAVRLGGVLLAHGRPHDAEPILRRATEQATNGRQRYLAFLFLGRATEQEEGDGPGRACALFRHALEAWPDNQSARLALARCLEDSGGSEAARPLVMDSLLESNKAGRTLDPWWFYPFGPRELAKARVESLWQTVLGRAFGP